MDQFQIKSVNLNLNYSLQFTTKIVIKKSKMIIANSRQRQSYSKLKPDLRQKQYNSIVEQQQQEQDSIIQWIKQNFSEQYSNCKKINKLEQLYDGIALAQIVSHFVSNQDMKEQFLNQIQIVNHLSKDRNIAVNNFNLIIATINQLFDIALSSKAKESSEIKMIKMAKKSIQKFTGQILIGNKDKMKKFMIQIIMLLPDLIQMIQKNAKLSLKDKKKPVDSQKQLKFFTNHSKNKFQQKASNSKIANHPKMSNSTQLNSNNNIQELSSIIGYSTQNNHDRTYFNGIHLNQPPQQKQLTSGCKSRKKSYQDAVFQQQGKSNQKQVQFKEKVQMLLDWMQTSFNIDIFQLTEPHLLLGQLVNVILSPHSKLNDNQKPIKPTHYQLGSYAVYQKSLNILTQVQRLPKFNLIQLMKQVEQGKVNEITFWSLIYDIYLMVKNKINDPKKPSISKKKSQQKPKSIKNPTQQSQKLPTQFNNDQNINIDNIRNQSVTQILKQNSKNTSTKLKDAPLYDEDVIRQTQLWLQQEMGLGHPLEKSKSIKNILQNPLLNGTLYAKIIQRLKIGSAKGIITPSEQKHLRSNIQNVKQQLLHRGYECARKLSIYFPTYNFYLGLLNQIKENYLSRQISNKKLIIEDKQKKMSQESQKLITQQEKVDIQSWLQNEFNLKLQHTNNTKFIPLNLLRTTIEGILNLNFLKETTQKIRQFNYIKLLQFFRSIGFTHYSTIKADHIINENISNSKKIQNTRWMVLRDLKIIKGQCSNKN